MTPPARRGPLTRALTTAALASYTANTMFGTAVAARLIDTRRIRWVHHALFVATSTLGALALLAAVVERRAAAFALAAAVVPLSVLPRTARRTWRHAAVALAAAPSFVVAAALARRES
ncbi:hypothetical protein [Microbacterium sp.]|uniref:hypothetical protein n=1 Tax=Microbacterium sp. TaxID=51671 RepID=UPI0028114D16|nr:hypothetical protein [Microbacterium sp.]